jgi:hypothetical protein
MAVNIAKATDLDPATLEKFIPALQTHNQTALQALPGITGEIVSKGEEAMMSTFVVAFRDVWVSAGCFVAFGAFGMSLHPNKVLLKSVCGRLTQLRSLVAAFLFDPEKEFNMNIDSPIAAKDKSVAI